MSKLEGKKVAILTENGFEESELTGPKKILEDAGAVVHIVSLEKDNVKAWDHDHWSIELPVNEDLNNARAENYDALVIPGGVINPDKMRREKKYVAFVQEFLDTGKVVGAICHGPQLLIETGIVRGLNMTSFPSIKTDLINAGAHWEDKEVVTDSGIVTSRKPDDIPAFSKKLIEEKKEG